MKTKLTPKFWCALTLFSLVGQIAWVVENMYLNVFMYKMFNASAADISLMVSASAVSATLTTVLIGALSDKIGKRKLFICGGYILWGISIFCFMFIRTDIINKFIPATVSAATVGASLVIVFDCIMTFFGSSANDAAFNAWLTDSVDSDSRGAAEGINAMMPLVAILAVFGGFMAFDLNLASSWTLVFAIIGAGVIAVGIVGIFIIKDSPAAPSKTGYLQNVIHGFLPSTVKRNPMLYLYLLCFIVFNISIQIFMPYLILYYEVSLKMTNYVFVMAPAIIIASVVTAFWGKVYDKKGFALSSLLSLLWLCIGYVVLYFFKSTVPVFIGSLLMMCGYLAGMAVFGAKIRDLIPSGKAGMFQGVRIFSQVLIPGVIGPFIGKSVLDGAEIIVNSDGTTSFVPNENIFLAALIAAIIASAVVLITIERQKPRLKTDLKTPFEDDKSTSWESEYPRPSMKRDSYISLCGEWSLSVTRKKGVEEELGSIKVPFPPESRLSGICRELKKGEKYVYRKVFTLPEQFNKGKVLINFGAVDQICELYINGMRVGEHIGGYLPFSFDITEFLADGENLIELHVTDNLDTDLAYGKQRKKRGGMWYTPISGIWQPVWLESVPCEYISSLKISSTMKSVTIESIGGLSHKHLKILTDSGIVDIEYDGDSFTYTPDEPRLWSPDSPYLYRFTLSDGVDTVESYFALREVSITKTSGKGVLFLNSHRFISLNGKPIFCHGLLDQGYFSDGIYLPATPNGYLFDILEMKKLGFNMLRKHIKIEPELFYYYCDKNGMLVFQDMVNSGKYNFLIDTALPTAGIKKGIAHKASAKRRIHFENDAKETLNLLHNHPSVIYYTIFNEGWGQYDADRIYNELKAIDPSRIYDSTSGWFTEKKSDVKSEHIYFKKLNLEGNMARPLVLSEFGGYSCKIDGHSFNLDKTYGYKFYKTAAEFEAALERLYLDEVIPMMERGLCSTVLTQVSDVEDETNGLVTYDRQVLKVNAEKMQNISNALFRKFDKISDDTIITEGLCGTHLINRGPLEF